MRQLKSIFLLFAATSFIFLSSCSKEKNPPPLGGGNDTPTNTNPGNSGGAAISTKVLSLGNGWGDIFQTGPKGILYVRNKSGVFNIYTPDDKGMFGSGNPFPGDPWSASANLYYMGVAQKVQTVMITNVPPAGLFRFDVDANGFLIVHPTTNPSDPFPTNFGFWYGDGWDNYDIIALNGRFVFQIAHNKGEELLRSKFSDFTDDWSTWNRPATLIRDDVGISFKDYRFAMSMGDNLLIVNSTGDLTTYVVDTDGNLDAGTKIGKGWDKYSKVASVGNDLLAIDANGDVFRYTIDLTKTNNDA